MKKMFIRKVASDLFFSISALVIMNGVIQIFVYPYLNRTLGPDAFGIVLYLLSVISVVSISFGSGANYSRMIISSNGIDSNGDYNWYLIISFIFCLIISFVVLNYLNYYNFSSFILYAILMSITTIRYYSDVDFRLNINYKGYFIYYLIISIGYIIGVLLFKYNRNWITVFIIGEVSALIYVSLKGNTLSKGKQFTVSTKFKSNIKTMIILTGSHLLSNVIMSIDRILILSFIGALEVTVFYSASLIGKMVALITVPLNSVIIGYLSKYKKEITKKLYLYILGTLVSIGTLMIIFTTILSNLFVNIMYPDIYLLAKPLFILANTGQIVFFLSNTLMVIVLKFTNERYQLKINIIYAIIFFIVTIPSLYLLNLKVFSIALILVNVFKFILVCIIGFKNLPV